MNMFDYSNIDTSIIEGLPKEIQKKVESKKEDDLQKAERSNSKSRKN